MEDITIPTGGAAPTTIKAFETGDKGNSTTGHALGQSIADAIGWLKDRIVLGPSASLPLNGTPPLTVPSTTQGYYFGPPTDASGGSAALWFGDGAAGSLLWKDFHSTNGATASILCLPMNLASANGQKLDGAYVRYRGNPTAGSLPANPAVLSLIRIPRLSAALGNVVTIASQADTALLAPYKAEHLITIAAGVNHTIDVENNAYCALLVGEYGTPSLASALYLGGGYTIIRTSSQLR